MEINLDPAETPANSAETEVVNIGQPRRPSVFTPSQSPSHLPPHRKTNSAVLIGIGAVAVAAVAAVGYFFMGQRDSPAETLPTHLGMFAQSEAKDRIDEIRRHDFTNALDGKASLLKDENLPSVTSAPSLVLYAESKDINVNDLRLIQLDTIKDDGNMQQIDFQAAPIDGKPEMKRLRVPDALANGKYAFALLEQYINEGKHKFWAFQVKGSSKGDNGSALKGSSFPTKPRTPTAPVGPRASIPPPTLPSAPAPSGAGQAFAIGSNVRYRNSPSLSAPIGGKLGANQRVYILGYTGHDCFKGRCGPWAEIQTDGGVRGYVLSVLLR